MKNPDELIQYYIVNKDLNMSPGKIATQVAHVATTIANNTLRFLPDVEYDKYLKWYYDGDQKKIILKAKQQKLLELISQGFEFIKDLGGKHHRFKRGYRNVINEGIRLNGQGEKCYLAIETSGHAALKENYFLDDGAYLISKILVKMAKLHKQGKSIEDLIKNLKISPESLELRFNILNRNFKDYGYKILDDLKKYIEKINGWNEAPNNYEGVRVNCNKLNGDGWFLLRISLHEPVLCLNIESDSKDGIKVIMDNLKNFLINYNELNISSFK